MVADHLRSLIQTGQLRGGQRVPSERQLAQELHVSRGSVQSAIQTLIDEGLINQEPNHRPVVQFLPRRRIQVADQNRNQIAVWLQPDLQDVMAAGILQGIRIGLGERGYNLVIGCPKATSHAVEQRSEAAFLETVLRNPASAGAIIWEAGGVETVGLYPELVRKGIPVVFIDREPNELLESDLVATNHKRAARRAVRHLSELGHRKIAMVVNDEPVSSVYDRIDGYRTALADAGIPFDGSYVLGMPDRRDEVEPAYDALVQKILAMAQPPTAIFAVHDRIALYLLDALRKAGVRVPQDISLIGFDWLMRWVPNGGELTTVAQPFEEIGRMAAERLLIRIHRPEKAISRHILFEAPLVVRATTAAPRVNISLRRPGVVLRR